MELNGRTIKMSYIIIFFLLRFLYFGAGDEDFILKSFECKNDVCLKEADNESNATIDQEIAESVIQKVLHKNSSKNSNRNETFEEGLHNELQADFLENEKPKSFSIDGPSALELYSGNGTEQYEEITFTDLITEDVSLSVKPEIENIPQTTSVPKLNITTTSTPYYEVKLSKAQSKTICLCDLMVHECDINCCCDEDCTSFHFQVFTKCNDISPEFDTKYCFQNNFIFENHTLYKMVQNTGGVFCIITDNLPVSLNYQMKPFITSLEAFNRSVSEKLYKFVYKSLKEFEFTDKAYQAGSVVWSVQNGELKPFKIPVPSLGRICASQGNIKYLIDEVSVCYNQYETEAKCGNSRSPNTLNFLKNMKIISNPAAFNKSAFDSTKSCTGKACIGIIFYLCQYIEKVPTCMKIENSNFPHIGCWGTVSDIKYQIWHNGSKGIAAFEAYIWLKNLPEDSKESLIELRTEVKHLWVATDKVFHRSGNPGYITGMAVMAGKKIYNSLNESAEKKEAIELSLNPEDWLSVLGAEKGICSSQLRIPVKFRENGQYMCSLKLTKNYFHKEKCTELQNIIFNLLTGTEVINITRENFFNKFVATFGNSKVEDTGDWVQVLIETISSQAVFKSNYFHLICKNIVTDLYISIVYTNIGSFYQPQSKIIGVSMRFGKHKDLIFNCDNPNCDSAHLTQSFKLTTFVQFVDVTKPAIDAFAEPLTLETRLPNDFFYPFFSKSSKSQFSTKFSLILSICLKILSTQF